MATQLVAFSSIFLATGIVLVIGAVRRWQWLVNPPTWLWFCYSQSLLKAIGGAEFCRIATLFMGYAFIAVAVAFLLAPLFATG